MKKKDIVSLLDEMLKPLFFNRKENNWYKNNEELYNVVNLQKSNYGESFYINYGFIIKDLELTTRFHVAYRLAGENNDEQKMITTLLDLTSNIPDQLRSIELRKFIEIEILSEFKSVITKNDLLAAIKNRPHMNDIPLIVKTYFSLI